VSAGSAFGTQPVVFVEDQFGNLETGDNSTQVTASLRTGNGPLHGTTTIAVSGGIAAFTDLADKLAETIVLQFSSSTGLPTIISAPVTISPSATSKLIVKTPPSSAARAGVPFATQPVLYETDQYGNLEIGDNTTLVKVSLGTGAGPLKGTTTVTVSGGIARFTNLSDNKAETVTLIFASAGLPGIASSAITISPASAATLSVAAPRTTTPGTPAAIQVTAFDPFGNLATDYRGTLHFTSSDKLASLPRNYSFTAADKGAHVFANGATLRTTGSQTIKAVDIATPSIVGSAVIQVGGSGGGTAAIVTKTPSSNGASHVMILQGSHPLNVRHTRFALGLRRGLAHGVKIAQPHGTRPPSL
jgi:hypothetical protein